MEHTDNFRTFQATNWSKLGDIKILKVSLIVGHSEDSMDMLLSASDDGPNGSYVTQFKQIFDIRGGGDEDLGLLLILLDPTPANVFQILPYYQTKLYTLFYYFNNSPVFAYIKL